MDFTVDNGTFNFINPPLPKLEALEEFRTDRFAIPQIESLLQEFLLIAKSTGDEMQTRELTSLLFSKIKNSDTFRGHYSALPESWNKLGLQNINNIIRNLDPTNTGFVNWRVLMTCLILLRSAVPTAAQISKIESSLEQNNVTENEFIGQNYWFEQTETSKDREYSHHFDRVKMIKSLLFRTNAKQEDDSLLLNVRQFATTLGQLASKSSQEKATFCDVLFN